MKFARAGFTLIEVTVAMSLIVIAFGGLITVLILSQEAKTNIKYDMVGQYLAKEGLELVRFKRDKNYDDYPAVLDAFSSIYNASGTPYSFTIDPSLTIVAAAPGTTVKTVTPLKIFNSEYGYSTNPAAVTTNFRRLITTTYYPAATPPYLQVNVEVSWQGDTKQKIITLQDELTDWRP